MITSPITHTKNVQREKTILTAFLIEGFQRTFGIDVSRFFSGLTEIELYRCLDTGYLFFEPSRVSGDGAFYTELEQFPWYYMEWKWEHAKASSLLSKVHTILEIGCGRGAFLKRLAEQRKTVIGLELNPHSTTEETGIPILQETIEEHAKKNAETYDAVCTFQVVEHIYQIEEFINASLVTLKKNGLLIVSVPNQDSAFQYDKRGFLNLPPHHMGLWTEQALRNLETFFPMKLVGLYREPLQPYHFNWYYGVIAEKMGTRYPPLKKYIRFLFPYSFVMLALKIFRHAIKGHTVMAVYQKNEHPTR